MYNTPIHIPTEGDVEATSYNASYTLGKNETSIAVAPITVVDDTLAEANMEHFTLSLRKRNGSDTLNYFVRRSIVTMTILDNDGKYYNVKHS